MGAPGRPSLTFRFGKAGAYMAPVVFIDGVIAFFTGFGSGDTVFKAR